MSCDINYPLRTVKPFCYLIRFEPEQKVTIGFLYWLLDYFVFSGLISSCQLFDFLHVWGYRGAGYLMYYALVLDRPLEGTSYFQNYWRAYLTPTAQPPCSCSCVTCTFTLWNQSWKGVYSLYTVLIAQPLLHNTTLYLHVHNVLFWLLRMNFRR